MTRILYLMLALLFSCNKGKECEKRYLHLCLPSEVRSLDPKFAYDYPSGHIVRMLYDGVTRFGLDGKITLAVAESYELSEDMLTYLFHLRPCKWSNGDPVTAYDFEYSWKRVISSNVDTTSANHFYPIKNVQAVVQKKASVDEVGIHALDERTLLVQLEHPTHYFLEALAVPSFCPVHSRIDQENPKWAYQAGSSFVTNGPFILKEWKHGNEMTLLKNPHYWDADQVKLPGIVLAVVQDKTTQLNLFEKGEIDWAGRPISRLPLDAIPTLRKQNLLHMKQNLSFFWFAFNVDVFPFTNKKMRRAFSLAMNRKELTDNILQEDEQPAMTVFNSVLTLQKEPYFKDADFEVAKQLFEEALLELGITKEELTITLSCPTEQFKEVVQAVQQQWHDVLGIRVQIQQEEWKVFLQKLFHENYQIASCVWFSYLRDPIYTLQAFKYKNSSLNISRWEHPRFQELLDASEQEIDPAKRKEIFHEAEALLMEEMPIAPVFFTTLSFLCSKNLKDVYVSECLDFDFKYAYFE